MSVTFTVFKNKHCTASVDFAHMNVHAYICTVCIEVYSTHRGVQYIHTYICTVRMYAQ